MLYDKKWDEKLPVDNFMSAKELQVSGAEYNALQKVLKMLENGEIQDVDPNLNLSQQNITKGLFMCFTGTSTACGTAACIGGWVASLMKANMDEYVWGYASNSGHSHKPLHELYWGNTGDATTAKQAAQALRNCLTKGNPQWDDIIQT